MMANIINVSIKKVREYATIPTHGSEEAAGVDLYSAVTDTVTILPGQTVLVPTGIAIALPAGFGAFIYARSGLASKKGLAPANKVGVVDSDYRGEIVVALHNHSSDTQYIHPDDRVAQMVIAPVMKPVFQEVRDLPESVRGCGGFGSTGIGKQHTKDVRCCYNCMFREPNKVFTSNPPKLQCTQDNSYHTFEDVCKDHAYAD